MEDTYTALQTDMDRDAYTPKRKHRRTATPALADSYGATQLLPAESLVANGDLLEAIGPPKPSSENGQPHDQRKPMEQPPVLHSDATPLPAAATEATSQELHQAPPVVLVQGEGLQHASAGAQLADDDDEFDYSSPGSKRAVPFTVPIFEAAPAPAHLITHISNAPLESFAEEDEECASRQDAGRSGEGLPIPE
ncbi:hypothetical protein WJX72_003169 [[Myrmecia] bisecta]|uniref:Uncharacterized protein n=1 Tax=[Myrmecia] bisecta TaxID=41462 RepID=A0AAW1PRY6_9CHLO